jgi:deazaflavin-dependent oxidoreductase (nitroreductase family)
MHSRKNIQERPSQSIHWPSVLLATLVATLVTLIVLIRGKYVRYNQRQINKRFVNPLMLKLAGHRHNPQGIVYHVGRRSGHSYTTPVVIMPVPNGFDIPLTYGPNVDWCRNILAAGQCTMLWHGNNYTVVEPALMNAEDVIEELSPIRQKVVRTIGVKNVLKVRIAAITPAKVIKEATGSTHS